MSFISPNISVTNLSVQIKIKLLQKMKPDEFFST